MSADRVHAIVAQTLRIPVSGIRDDLAMQECATWDSLSHMELIAAIEDEFGLELDADDIVAMVTVAAIKTTLRRHSVDA